jgi:Flp pilus assembly protein CpaB
MKWATGILLILGLLAAGSTAVLFGWVQAKNLRSPSPAADVLLAQTDLPARTRLVAEHVKVERVPKAGLPAGYFTNQAQAIGKTLKIAVVKGQPLTGLCCLPATAIDDLLRPGMLAFQISLGRRSTAVDLLYPGCIVDVFATFPLQDRKKGEAVTTPLLQNIQVLGVRDETVVTASEEKEGSVLSKKSSSHGGDVTIALEVTSRQAAALQLSLERGMAGSGDAQSAGQEVEPDGPDGREGGPIDGFERGAGPADPGAGQPAPADAGQ